MYCPNDDATKIKRLPRKGLAALLCALLVLAVLAAAVPALASSVPAPGSNAGEDPSGTAQAVQAQLATLQQAYIQPEWLPDVRANEAAVQALLNSYLALTLDGRTQLTAQNNTDLRAYFAALYEVQGKDAAGVDALFEDSSAAGYTTPPPPPPEPVSIAPSSVSLPAPSSVVQSQPPPQSQPPQPPPGGDSWGRRTIASALLLLLTAVAVAVFARFVIALRRAGKNSKTQDDVDIRAQELFGESYDPVENPVDDDFLPPLPQVEETAVPLPTASGAPQGEADAPGSFAMFAPENAPAGKRDRKGKRDKTDSPDEPDRAEKSAAIEPPSRKPSPFEGGAGASRFDKAFSSTGPLSTGGAAPPSKSDTPPAPPPDSPFGANPDKRNAITTRSFSAPPRTGRPGKMAFRQGSPEDMDAIDE